jgi:7-keto-8-aminopelargonate synthetase-like enzyme
VLDAARLKNALSKSNAHFASPKGPHLFSRLENYARWIDDRHQLGYWHYSRQLGSPPTPVAEIGYLGADLATGINLAVQDYLSLSTHPEIQEAAISAVKDFGVHSAGSAMLLGNSPLSLKLELMISDLVQMEHVLLFPTGWGAGFGAVKGLVREDDHVVLDALSHACLQEGAGAATKNIHRYKHLDVESASEMIKSIRARDAQNGIIVITEGIFSMDSDSPDLAGLQEVCREFGAILLVDVAHDLGALGPSGSGQLGVQGLLGNVDLVIGAFSKTFASNGGFVATNDVKVKNYLKWFANPHTFSNALSPIQCAVVSKAIEIVQSWEGDDLRGRLFSNATLFRGALADAGLSVLGAPSAIVPVLVGKEALGRRASKLVNERGTFTNMVEFPAVGLGAARFRCQLMATHEPRQLMAAARTISEAVMEAGEQLATEIA